MALMSATSVPPQVNQSEVVMNVSDGTAGVAMVTMISTPIAIKSQVPLVSFVLFDAGQWVVTIGDLGFLIGALLALAKLVQMLFGRSRG